MKKIIVLFSFLFLYYQGYTQPLYKIVNITQYDSVFCVIRIEKNASLFDVISICKSSNAKNNIIKKKQYYKLLIEEINFNLCSDLETIKGRPYFVNFDKKSKNKLYFAKNLSGLSLMTDTNQYNDIETSVRYTCIFCDACRKQNKFTIIFKVPQKE